MTTSGVSAVYALRAASTDSVHDWVAQDGLLAVRHILWDCACEARVLADECRNMPIERAESSGFSADERYRQAAAIEAWCEQLEDWQFSGEDAPSESAEHDEQQSQEVAEEWAAAVRAEAIEVLDDLAVR